MVMLKILLTKIKEYFSLTTILLVLILTIEVYLIADIIVTFSFSFQLPSFISPIAFVLFFSLLLFLRISPKRITILVIAIPLLFTVVASALYFTIYIPFRNNSHYTDLPNNSSIFIKKKVMVIVPHQDDDINIVGGMIDNYVKNGSEIFPVFVTNGDAKGLTQTRFNEAIECWKKIGVPESNISFLGYGDTWNENGPHIYNSYGDNICVSAIGKKKTYGTNEHPAFNNGVSYTYNNFKNDFKSVIKTIKPSVLFVSDYDEHQDHRAVSLMFEKAMGELLKEEKDYSPIVYKAYAYRTAWCSDDDYYRLNISKTNKPKDEEYCPMIYNWGERVRFPIYSTNLSRSIFNSSLYSELSIYESQHANSVAKNIISGDKVFWQRRTDSILRNAKIKTSSGSAKCLNDFNILDSNNVKQFSYLPYDGVWTPDKADKKQSINISLNQKSDISYIYIYDHPSMKTNIKKAKISFNNGDYIVTDNINKNGSASKIKVNKKDVSSFTVSFIDYEGEAPSVAEVEAFVNSEQNDDTFIKLTDNNDDFVYDYISEDVTELSVYSNNSIPHLTDENYSVYCDNKMCACTIENNRVIVYCPKNELCRVTINMKNSEISDTVIIRNNSWINNTQLFLGQRIEDDYIYPISQAYYYNLTFYRFFHDLKSLF